MNYNQNDTQISSTLNPFAVDERTVTIDETNVTGSVNPELKTESSLTNEDGKFTDNTMETKTQNYAVFSVQVANKGDHETTSADSTMEKDFANIEDGNIKLYENQISIPKLNISDSSDATESERAADVLAGIENISQSASSIKDQELKASSNEQSSGTINKYQHVPLNISNSSAVDGGEIGAGRCDPGKFFGKFLDRRRTFRRLLIKTVFNFHVLRVGFAHQEQMHAVVYKLLLINCVYMNNFTQVLL